MPTAHGLVGNLTRNVGNRCFRFKTLRNELLAEPERMPCAEATFMIIQLRCILVFERYQYLSAHCMSPEGYAEHFELLNN